MYTSLTFQEVLTKQLYVMDTTAITLSEENNIPIVVFNMIQSGNIKKAILGKKVGTKIATGG